MFISSFVMMMGASGVCPNSLFQWGYSGTEPWFQFNFVKWNQFFSSLGTELDLDGTSMPPHPIPFDPIRSAGGMSFWFRETWSQQDEDVAGSKAALAGSACRRNLGQDCRPRGAHARLGSEEDTLHATGARWLGVGSFRPPLSLSFYVSFLVAFS